MKKKFHLVNLRPRSIIILEIVRDVVKEKLVKKFMMKEYNMLNLLSNTDNLPMYHSKTVKSCWPVSEFTRITSKARQL